MKLQNYFFYSLVFFVIGSSQLQATVIETAITNPTTLPIIIDLDGDGNTDYTIREEDLFFTTTRGIDAAGPNTRIGREDANRFLLRFFESNTSIDGAIMYNESFYDYFDPLFAPAAILSGGVRYIALEIVDGASSNYGWLKVVSTDGTATGYSFESFAYETVANTAILTPDSGSTLSVDSFSKAQQNNIILSPNPASNFVNIKNKTQVKIESMTIISLNGGVVKNEIGITKEFDENVFIGDLENGLYIIEIKDFKGNTILKKLLVSH